ncbi:MAG: Holliday junction resolvase RuvX [Desulfovibrio sp.]|nr:Holliday junction resolvase RuvX [Desulfovibrio sp.]
MKLVGIDYGLVRTGLAATDPDGVLAYPLKTLDLNAFPSRKALLEELAGIIRQEKPDAVVVGLPLMPDGTESLTTRQVRNFAGRLVHRMDCPVLFMEELLSSEEAAWDLAEAGVRDRNKRKAALDQQAAVRILESYLHQPECARPVDVRWKGPDQKRLDQEGQDQAGPNQP